MLKFKIKCGSKVMFVLKLLKDIALGLVNILLLQNHSFHHKLCVPLLGQDYNLG